MSRFKHASRILPYPVAYVPAAKTNIAKTIAAERRRLKAEAEAQRAAEVEAQEKVRPIITKKRGAA